MKQETKEKKHGTRRKREENKSQIVKTRKHDWQTIFNIKGVIVLKQMTNNYDN